MRLDKPYLICALTYATVGMALGVGMAASHDHGQFVTHTHVLLVGFVTSLLYAAIHRLWLPNGSSALGKSQFLAHQVGALTMMLGLGLLYGLPAEAHRVEPFLAAGSIAVLVGALLMLILVIGQRASQPLVSEDAVDRLT